GAGNDSTSVGWSLPRKRRLSERSSPLVVINTLTAPRKPAARLARPTNRTRAVSLRPDTVLRKITTGVFLAFSAVNSSLSWQNKQEGHLSTLLTSLRLCYSATRFSAGEVSFFPGIAVSEPLVFPLALALFSSSDICSSIRALCSS